MNKIYLIISYILITITSLLLMNEIHDLKTTITLYVCLTTINIVSMFLYQIYKEETKEEAND